MRLTFLLQIVFAFVVVSPVNAFNQPAGIYTWCGKAYLAIWPSFDPGGWLDPPNATSSTPLLDLRFYPRMNLYLAGESNGSFIVDTPVSYQFGAPFSNSTFAPKSNASVPFNWMKIQIMNADTRNILVPWSNISVNSTGNEFSFSLSSFKARSLPYSVHITGVSPDGIQTYQSTSILTVLPPRNDSGSVARIDQLYGALQVRSSITKSTWKPILPLSFFVSWEWITSTMSNASTSSGLSDFRAAGYNIIHPIPPGGDDPFDRTVMNQFLSICDSLELYVMYDMRHTYQNATSVASQLSVLQTHPSLLLYYTADEPDGSDDPLNATALSYQTIKSIDSYHPVSLLLNCLNYWFEEYTSGADIIMEDAYPTGLNSVFSPRWYTPCNLTYGDCGCDNCHMGDPAYPAHIHNTFLDISIRLDDYVKYQEWLGLTKQAQKGYGQKPLWGVPQAFYDGQADYWSRLPTADEEAVITMLRINHGATGIVAWDYPTDPALDKIMGSLAKVVTSSQVTGFILGAKRMNAAASGGYDLVDVATWKKNGKAFVNVVYQSHYDFVGAVEVTLPYTAMKVESVLSGPTGWTVEGGKLTKQGLVALEVAMIVLNLG